jgi:hypothetical protein
VTGFILEGVSTDRGQEDIFADKYGIQDAEKSIDYITIMF